MGFMYHFTVVRDICSKTYSSIGKLFNIPIQSLVASGQSEPTVGVGTQALPTPTAEYDTDSGESGGLLKRDRRGQNM